MKPSIYRIGLLWTATTVGILAPPAMSQTPVPSTSSQDTALEVSGTAVSSSPNRLTVKTDKGLYVVFVFDRYTNKPKTIPPGAPVRVISLPTGESGVRIASDVIVTGAPPTPPPNAPAQPGATPQPAPAAPPKPYESGEVVPVSVRRLESDIERQSRRFSVGFRTGVGLDPEVLLIGVQARMGPFFHRNFSFRPNVDFGFGEVTKLFAVDLNGVYRLPLNVRQSRWSAFVGAGPCLNFMHRNFEEAAAGNTGIDFGEFDFQAGLNILTGVDFRSGLFVEAKTTVWAGPHLRLSVGYSF